MLSKLYSSFQCTNLSSIAGVCYRFIGDMVRSFGVLRSSSNHLNADPPSKCQVDDLTARALVAVFAMDANGKIKKERARRVVEKLGLIQNEEDKSSFDLPGGTNDELQVEEVLNGLNDEGLKRVELLHRAFAVFDLDGDGFIEAVELKRVLECLELDKGWDKSEIERMVRVVDLNSDGKVDFGEFELMMG